jgi:hypothetical protein
MIKAKGIYIFGIISPTVDDNALAGIDYPGIHRVTCGNISAVVEDSDIVDYKNMDGKYLTELLLKHQKVIEPLMSMGYTVIPMKMGTVVRNEQEVGSILDKSSSLLKDIMEKINGKIEIDIVVTWNNFPSVLKLISMEKEIKEFKEKLMLTSVQITAEDQQKAGLMVVQALSRRRNVYSLKIHEALIPASHGIRDHEVVNDQMVFNSAFLIKKHEHGLFDAEVEKLNAEFGEELNFKYIGPLPCYSFYTIEVDKIRFESVDQAREKLGLSSSATKDEIKSAYKMKASAVHPDKNHGMPGIEKEFDETNKAYKMLMDYCAASDLASTCAQYSFLEKDVNKNSILVKLRACL